MYGMTFGRTTTAGIVPSNTIETDKGVEGPSYDAWHLTILRTGALISALPTAVHPLESGASQGGIHEAWFDDDGGNHVAGCFARCSATCAADAAERARNARCNAPDGNRGRLARSPAERPES